MNQDAASDQGSPERIVLRGHRGVGPAVEGEALVSRQGFSARYDLNRAIGTYSRESHDLYGHSVVGKILVHTTAKGGVATAWALLDMRGAGRRRSGLLFQQSNPIMVQGAALAGVAILDRPGPDPLDIIETGDFVRLDPARSTVEVEKRSAASPDGGGRLPSGDVPLARTV